MTIFKMTNDKFECNLEQWEKLDEIQRNNIVNHYWDPYNPTIGQKTKKQIVDYFTRKLKIPGRQFGLKTFGWTQYMLYVIVDNSKQKVPSNFLGLAVNKGVIVNDSIAEKTTVKFRYGGATQIDLTKNVIIS
jgi:hypothetical protein